MLFVCTGNLCRSPFAEHLFRREAAGAGLRAEAESAGTFTVVGERVPEVGVEVGREFGVDLSSHLARLLDAPLLRRADLALGMTRAHQEELRALRESSGAKGRLRLLGEFDGGSEEIPDPYGLEPDAFRETYARIEACVRALVERLRARAPD